MTTMRFYRGITLPVLQIDQAISTIAEAGFAEGRGRWRMEQFHPGPLDVLFAKPDLSLQDTRPEGRHRQPAVCACGDEMGAAHYAWQHNRSRRNDAPLMIAFEAEHEAVAIDGKDFLYTVFQMGEPMRARTILERSFGPRILRYAEKAWGSDDQRFRIALCDLAIHDPEVVKDHYAARPVIAGRYKTIFRNAFTVKLPISGAAIVRVWSPTEPPDFATPDVSLADVVRS